MASTARATRRGPIQRWSNIEQKLKKPDILQLLDSGRGNMPAFAFLTKPQKETVADLLLNQEPLAPADRQADISVGGITLNEPYTHTATIGGSIPTGIPR